MLVGTYGAASSAPAQVRGAEADSKKDFEAIHETYLASVGERYRHGTDDGPEGEPAAPVLPAGLSEHQNG